MRRSAGDDGAETGAEIFAVREPLPGGRQTAYCVGTDRFRLYGGPRTALAVKILCRN